MFTIPANFICKFKIGDNIIYNLRVLGVLYEQYNALATDPIKQRLLIKPIIIINVSIAEALLYDFLLRVKVNIYEGVLNLRQDVIDAIRGKKFDQFQHYIAQARKHDLFDASNTNFYAAMDSLRIKRNRIHIQNIYNYEPENEYKAFTEKDKITSEKVLEKILLTLSVKHLRPEHLHSVNDFILPWDCHFNLVH